MFIPLLISVGAGLAVALLIGVIGIKRSSVAGVSITAGLITATFFGHTWGLWLACALAGLFGWMIARIILMLFAPDRAA